MGTPRSHKARATQTEGRLHPGEQGQCSATSRDTRAPWQEGTTRPVARLNAYSPGHTVLAPGSSQDAPDVLKALLPQARSRLRPRSRGSTWGEEKPKRLGDPARRTSAGSPATAFLSASHPGREESSPERHLFPPRPAPPLPCRLSPSSPALFGSFGALAL